MKTLVKALIALGLVLPLGAYVAGSLAAAGADDPRPHDTIVIRDHPTRSASPHSEPGPSDPSPSDRPTPDDHGGPEVVTPSLHDLGDDHGGGRSGHGGGHGSDDSGGGGHG